MLQRLQGLHARLAPPEFGCMLRLLRLPAPSPEVPQERYPPTEQSADCDAAAKRSATLLHCLVRV